MIMAQTSWIYKGSFLDDQFHDRQGILMLPNMMIYQGCLKHGKTTAIGLLMYPNGNIYYG